MLRLQKRMFPEPLRQARLKSFHAVFHQPGVGLLLIQRRTFPALTRLSLPRADALNGPFGIYFSLDAHAPPVKDCLRHEDPAVPADGPDTVLTVLPGLTPGFRLKPDSPLLLRLHPGKRSRIRIPVPVQIDIQRILQFCGLFVQRIISKWHIHSSHIKLVGL